MSLLLVTHGTLHWLSGCYIFVIELKVTFACYTVIMCSWKLYGIDATSFPHCSYTSMVEVLFHIFLVVL